jgi:hypothetical protein
MRLAIQRFRAPWPVQFGVAVSVLCILRGLLHKVAKKGCEQMLLLWFMSPADLEDWFRALGRPRQAGASIYCAARQRHALGLGSEPWPSAKAETGPPLARHRDGWERKPSTKLLPLDDGPRALTYQFAKASLISGHRCQFAPKQRQHPAGIVLVEERINRRLAAVLAADVVGYSRLMAADEAGTLVALKRHRETIFDPAVIAHNGRIVELIGDGVIAEFGSVVDAVKCALSVQCSGASKPDQNASQPTIVVRIGINLGESLSKATTSMAMASILPRAWSLAEFACPRSSMKVSAIGSTLAFTAACSVLDRNP